MEIPQYPAYRPLSLEDKPLLDDLFERLQPRVSELTFAGLFLFRHAHDYHLTCAHNSLVLLGKGYDSRHYFLPPLGGDVAGALDVLFGHGLKLYGADEAFMAKHLMNEGLQVTEDRDSFDYIYLR
ncbi:MAG: phosphatidylglycerol lysyltransferase domain-containing protein, partial [Pseudomonadota bacterium]